MSPVTKPALTAILKQFLTNLAIYSNDKKIKDIFKRHTG